MLTLAIETSGLVGSIALVDGETCVEERALELSRQHGQVLVAEIERLLAAHSLRVRDCGLIAVSTGPGSFTGLRVGVVCAKTLAYTLGCGLAGVDTLLAIACNAPDDVGQIEIVADAQRGDLFLGKYRRDAGGDWVREEPIDIVPAASWLAGLTAGQTTAGPGLERLAPLPPLACRVLPRELWHPRAGIIGRLGVAAAARGALEDPWSLQPVYIRRSSAEEKWEARSKAPPPP